jgi:hypothetical protein
MSAIEAVGIPEFWTDLAFNLMLVPLDARL